VATPERLTKRERREQARQERIAREAAESASAQRRRRIWQLGGVLAVAVVIVIAAIAISSSGSGSSGLAKGKKASATVSEVSSLLSGIPQSGNVLGNQRAPVTMQYFGDLECPVCQAFTLATLPQTINQDVRAGKLKIQYRALQTATAVASTFAMQQVAALAAGRQNLMWNYIELFYHEQGQENSGYVTESYLTNLARQLPGLNLAQWTAARSDSALTAQVSADQAAASQHGYGSTPTLVFQGPRGTKAETGLIPYATVAQDLQAVS